MITEELSNISKEVREEFKNLSEEDLEKKLSDLPDKKLALKISKMVRTFREFDRYKTAVGDILDKDETLLGGVLCKDNQVQHFSEFFPEKYFSPPKSPDGATHINGFREAKAKKEMEKLEEQFKNIVLSDEAVHNWNGAVKPIWDVCIAAY